MKTDVKMRNMRRCEDEKVRKCEDVKTDVRTDVKM